MYIFTIGSHVKKYENSSEIKLLFERLTADAHEIGNHGWRDEQAIRLSPNELRQQIIDTESIINKYAVLERTWFRPGSGFFNRTTIEIGTSLGYKFALGSIYPHDSQIPHPRLNSYFIEHKLYPGTTVILHDRFATIQTLHRVLPAIQKQNHHIITLTLLMDISKANKHDHVTEQKW